MCSPFAVDVMAIIKFVKIGCKQWMVYPFIRKVGLQILLGNIGFVPGVVDQDLVPGYVFRWSGNGNFVIPCLRSQIDGVNIDDDTSIIEQLVADKLPKTIFCLGQRHQFALLVVDFIRYHNEMGTSNPM